MISSPLKHLLSGLEFIFNHFFNLNNFVNFWADQLFLQCRLPFRIHQKIESRYFRFAGQTYSSRPLWVSPGQSTICSKFIFRAWAHNVPESNPYNKSILLPISFVNQTKSGTQDGVCGLFRVDSFNRQICLYMPLFNFFRNFFQFDYNQSSIIFFFKAFRKCA